MAHEAEHDQPGSALDRRLLVAGVVGAGAAALAGQASAGPLDPPPGPAAPTGKPIDEIEPRTPLTAATTPGDAAAEFIISQPGSYYLLRDLSVPAGKTGIRIAADDVTIDLCGLRLVGAGAGSRGITDGAEGRVNITVRNGGIHGMGAMAIFLLGSMLRLEDLALSGNGGAGILASGAAHVERVLAHGNNTAASAGQGGIVVGGHSVVAECSAIGNSGVGIAVSAHGLVVACLAGSNTGRGIEAGPTCAVLGCHAYGNGQAGIQGQHGCVVESCRAESNTGTGVSVSFGSVVRQSAAKSNGGDGFALFEGCLAAGCSALLNQGHGLTLNTGNAVIACIASANAMTGINAASGTGSAISGCCARQNQGNGITVANASSVRDNLCTLSGLNPASSGISVTGQLNRIEGNLTAENGRGLHVATGRNLVARNASGHNATNWNIAANCPYGPVVNLGIGVSPGMAGDGTVASVLTTTDPFANFTV